ncbi:hypothetical protein Q4I30_001463, partial [Leishmania utingensis]
MDSSLAAADGGGAAAVRSGLHVYSQAQANAAASGTTALPNKALDHVKQMSRSQSDARRSGSKRGFDEATATDNVQQRRQDGTAVPNTAPNQVVEVMAPPPKKKKVTYALPHQNMEEGHFYVVLGEDIDVSTQRFKILSLLGEGTFGKVVESWDRKRKEYCAVKIVRNVPKYTR